MDIITKIIDLFINIFNFEGEGEVADIFGIIKNFFESIFGNKE